VCRVASADNLLDVVADGETSEYPVVAMSANEVFLRGLAACAFLALHVGAAGRCWRGRHCRLCAAGGKGACVGGSLSHCSDVGEGSEVVFFGGWTW